MLPLCGKGEKPLGSKTGPELAIVPLTATASQPKSAKVHIPETSPNPEGIHGRQPAHIWLSDSRLQPQSAHLGWLPGSTLGQELSSGCL